MKKSGAPVWILGFALFGASQSYAQYPDCPSSDGSDLTSWRDSTVNAYFTGSSSAASSALATCFGTVVPACLAQINSALNTQSPDSNLYPTSVDPLKINPPEEFAVPGQPNAFQVPANFESLWQQRGWRVAKFKTRGSGGFDASTSTLYILFVPGSSFNPALNYDRYIQFSLATLDSDAIENPVPRGSMPSAADYARETRGEIELPGVFSMVMMEKSGNGHQARPYFQLFRRGAPGDPSFVRESSMGEASCYACHPNGLRAISPLGYTTRAGEAQLPSNTVASISFINNAMSTYGPLEWRSVVNPETGESLRYTKPELAGPVIGPMRPLTINSAAQAESDLYPTRTKGFIIGADGQSGCAFTQRSLTVEDVLGRAGMRHTYKMSANPQVDWQKVKTAMNCAMCHNGQGRGALNRQTDSSVVAFKVLGDQTMPFGSHNNVTHTNTLTDDERIALYNCLYEEEPVEYRSWMKQKTCELNPNSAVGPAAILIPAPNPVPAPIPVQ